MTLQKTLCKSFSWKENRRAKRSRVYHGASVCEKFHGGQFFVIVLDKLLEQSFPMTLQKTLCKSFSWKENRRAKRSRVHHGASVCEKFHGGQFFVIVLDKLLEQVS
jgi:alkylated DNA repair dioxygenase AlkB